MSDWRALVAQSPAPADANIHRIDLSRSAEESHHLVQIRDREPLHTHERHSLTVFVLDGQGRLILGDRVVPCRAGTVAVIPMGVPHAFVNAGKAPATAHVIFRPAFDGKDVQPVDQP